MAVTARDLWGEARALGGTHAGGEMGSPSPPQAPIFLTFFFFARFFTLFSWEFGALAAMPITPCDILSALLTVPCCSTDRLHSSRP